MKFFQKFSVLSNQLQLFFARAPKNLPKTDMFIELQSQAEVAPEWKQCHQAIIDSANNYLRMHWGTRRGFFSVLTTGVQGYQRVQRLKQFVSNLDLSKAKGRRDLMASVSAIRLSSSKNLTGELDRQLKRFTSKTFEVGQFNLKKLIKREQELTQFFDGKISQPTSSVRSTFGIR